MTAPSVVFGRRPIDTDTVERVEPIDAAVAETRAARFPLGATVTIGRLADDLHRTLAELRPTEPISWLPSIDGWLITGYPEALEVLRRPASFTVDDERFTTGRVVGPSMLSTDGIEHHAHRQPFESLFRRASVTGFTDPIRATATELVGGFTHRREAELRSAYAAPLAVSVIAAFLGFHGGCDTGAEVAAVDGRLLTAYRTIVDTVVGLPTGRTEPDDASGALADLGDLLDRTVRRGGPMAELAARSDVSGDMLRSNVAVILFGAIETCEGMTANAIGHVLGDRGVTDRVRSGDADIDRVVNESLRLEPAAAVVDRYATADVDLDTRNGVVAVAQGDLVQVSLAGANRDPTVFVEPDRFDPGRARIGHHLAFARGPHVCLGLHLAKLQAAIALQTLLTELPNLELDPARSTPPRGSIFRKPQRVVANW